MQRLVRLLCTVSILLTVTHRLPAPTLPRNILKTFFEKGDKPTQQQFGTLIDSFATETPDGLSIVGIGVSAYTAGSPFNPATKQYVDAIIGPSTTFAPVGGSAIPLPVMETEFGGQSGFLALQLTSPGSSGLYYGFFQIRMEDPLAIDPPGIHVDYFAFNTTPGEAITAASVPEPAAVGLVAVAGALMLKRRPSAVKG